ncbi:MAG TPA: YidC/Oxa1 family insertase periplasmic-domain containing protein [Lacipirellula sp.]
MNRRVLLFFLLSFIVIQVTAWMATPPRDEQAAKQAAEGDAADAANDPAEDDAEAAGDDAANDNADEGPNQDALADDAAGAAEPEGEVPARIVTLGSVDESTGYRMLVHLTNAGAAVTRIELASPRYLDLHDRKGYLGHLSLTADGGAGLLVQAVGHGTPAAEAGVQVGDRIVEAGRQELTPLKTLEEFAKVLAETRPGQELKLAVQRDGNRQTLTATLERRPLEVIRPEAENVLLRKERLPEGFEAPPSFLLTLAEIDNQRLADDKEALPGVDLHTANWRIVPDEQGQAAGDAVTFERRLPDHGLVVTKRYRLKKAADAQAANAAPAYDLTLEISIRNEGEGEARTVAYRLDGPNGLPIEGWWYATKVGRGWSAAGLRDVVGRFFLGATAQQGAVAIVEDDVEPFEGEEMAFMSVDAQYFAAALLPIIDVPDESWIPRVRSVVAGTAPPEVDAKYANVTCQLYSEPLAIEPGQTVTHGYTVFAGPKQPELLAQYYPDEAPAYSINDLVYYGLFGPVARAMVGLLHVFYSFVGNYGIAIIVLTVLVRGLMFPVSRGQAKSMAKLQELRPEMEKIKEKYKGDQQKQAAAMQQLYRKHNVNPLAGCLPMLIQLPVFIGLYRGLAVDVELRGSPLISESVRWCSNLAAPDMLYDWSWFMPDFITRGEGLLGLGPYLNVLPLVTIVLFLAQQKMFMPEPTNEQAALQQKVMKYMMIFMGILFYKVPSGLCIYFIASSLWGIAERKLIPPPSASGGSSGPAPFEPAPKSSGSGGKLPQKWQGKDGSARGRQGAKAKRRK